MTATLAFSGAQIAALLAIVFAAGIVRGFTGFALSAFILALAVVIIPPVELIPLMFWLEIGASLLMLRSGWQDSDRQTALILIAGSAIGAFFGIGLTVALDPGVSRIVALVVLITLAAMQLGKLRVPGLDTVPGTATAGLLAGIVTGLSGVGGMVVALYVLSRNADPRTMRGTLVLYLFGTSAVSFVTHMWWGTMTELAVYRSLALMPACLLGVWIGTKLFVPRFERYYRPVCLWLLIGLAAVSLARSVL